MFCILNVIIHAKSQCVKQNRQCKKQKRIHLEGLPEFAMKQQVNGALRPTARTM